MGPPPDMGEESAALNGCSKVSAQTLSANSLDCELGTPARWSPLFSFPNLTAGTPAPCLRCCFWRLSARWQPLLCFSGASRAVRPVVARFHVIDLADPRRAHRQLIPLPGPSDLLRVSTTTSYQAHQLTSGPVRIRVAVLSFRAGMGCELQRGQSCRQDPKHREVLAPGRQCALPAGH